MTAVEIEARLRRADFFLEKWDGGVSGMNPRPTVGVTTDEKQMQVLRLRPG
jgi:hypothetical protein